MEDELLGTERVAEYLGVGHVTVWRWCRDGILPCLKVGRGWRIRRSALEGFVGRGERPSTLAGQLSSFLSVPDNVIGVVENRELMHALDAAFFRVGEAKNGLLVKFIGGEPELNEDEARLDLERRGLEVARLEREGRFRFDSGPEGGREQALEGLLAREKDEGRVVWASFNWSARVDLEAALRQQEAMSGLVEGRRPVVVKTAVLEEVLEDWPIKEQRRAREVHAGMIWLTKSGLSLSRVVPAPEY